MLEVLDVDKSDDVSLQELTDFWMYAPPLRLGDGAFVYACIFIYIYMIKYT